MLKQGKTILSKGNWPMANEVASLDKRKRHTPPSLKANQNSFIKYHRILGNFGMINRYFHHQACYFVSQNHLTTDTFSAQ